MAACIEHLCTRLSTLYKGVLGTSHDSVRCPEYTFEILFDFVALFVVFRVVLALPGSELCLLTASSSDSYLFDV